MSLRAPQQQIKRPTSVSKTNGSSLNPERRSVAGNQNLPRRFPTSVARLVFHQLFRSTGRFGDSIARRPNFGRKSKYLQAQSISKLRNIEPRQGFLRRRPPVKRSGENRALLRLAGSCRRHFGRFAGNLDLPLENLFSSGCFKFPAEYLFFQRKICFSSWKIYFPANVLIFRLNIYFSSGRFVFPAGKFIFQLMF